jgi:hypothetical protein
MRRALCGLCIGAGACAPAPAWELPAFLDYTVQAISRSMQELDAIGTATAIGRAR